MLNINVFWLVVPEKKLAPVASMVNVHHLRPRTGLVGPESV